MDEQLSVSAIISRILGFIGDALGPVFAWLSDIGWDLGDWTIATPLILPIGLWFVLRVRRRPTRGRPYFKLALLGLVLGGIIEHFQPDAEAWLSGPGTAPPQEIKAD